MNTKDYPKPIWVLVQSMVVLEDDREVIDSKYDKIVGGTFNPDVAEKLASVLKDNQSLSTMIRSDVDSLPKKVLDTIDSQTDSQTPKSEDRVDQLLDMVDLSDRT